MKILLVDDEPLELYISKKFLSMEHEVAAFTAIPEALEWVKINSFDILVSDYHLEKDFHAHDLLKAIQAIHGNTFRSYVLTNHIDDTMKAALIGAGFSAVIEKPLSPDKFKSAADVANPD